MNAAFVTAINGYLIFTGWWLSLAEMQDYNNGEVVVFALTQLPTVSIDGAHVYIKAKEETT